MKVHETLSSAGWASTGCPQGTVLGSVIFLLFIDQIQHVIQEPVKFCIYADDVKLVMKVNDERDQRIFQKTLDTFYLWSVKMGLKLSMHKCGVLHFGPRNGHFGYSLGNTILSKINLVKDLGVRFSNSLTFSEHVVDVVRRCALICSWILRAFVLSSPSAYLKMYETHVVSLWMYASVVWNPIKCGDLELLQKLQNRFLRRVEFRCKLPRHCLELPTVADRMTKADMKQLRKIIRDEERFDDLFDIRYTTSRAGFVIKPKTQAKTQKINHLFPWRVTRIINSSS